MDTSSVCSLVWTDSDINPASDLDETETNKQIALSKSFSEVDEYLTGTNKITLKDDPARAQSTDPESLLNVHVNTSPYIGKYLLETNKRTRSPRFQMTSTTEEEIDRCNDNGQSSELAQNIVQQISGALNETESSTLADTVLSAVCALKEMGEAEPSVQPNLVTSLPTAKPASPRPGSKSRAKTFQKSASLINNIMVATRPPSGGTEGEVIRRRKTFRNMTSALNLTKTARKILIEKDSQLGAADIVEECLTVNHTLLYEKLRVLFGLLFFIGVYFIPQKKTLTVHRAPLKMSSKFQISYCVSGIILLAINAARYMLAFGGGDTFGYILFFKITWLVMWIESVLRAVVSCLIARSQTDGLRSLFMSFEKVCYPDGIIPYETDLGRFLYYNLGISIMWIALSACLTSYGFFMSEDMARLFGKVILVPLPDDGTRWSFAFKIILIILVTWCIAISALTHTLFAVVCYILHKEFEYFDRTFAMKISPNGTFQDDLEKFRLRHQQRCKLVQQSDDVFKHFVALCYSTITPNLCLVAYAILDPLIDAEYRLYGLFLILWFLYILLGMSVIAIRVNTQAHKPLTHIHSINSNEANMDRGLVVQMFLNRLTGTSIGMTAWDMFVINKPTMLTVFGMMMTYFFLLVQFQNPLEAIDDNPGECGCLLLDHLHNNLSYYRPVAQ